MNQITGGALLARTLQAAGVEDVFSLHGGHLDAFLIACADHGIRLTDTRHEASAGHAAEAYARATGRIGVAVLTAGPGFTNAYTALANAYLDRMPVLFVVGAPSTREGDLNTLQGGIDQIAAASHVTKWAYRIGNGARIPEVVEQAIRRAMTGTPGPVLLEIPIEVMFTPIKAPPRIEELGNFALTDGGPAPSARQIDALIGLLSKAERPVVIAGGGATLSRSAEALVAFAERTGVPVTTGVKGEGLMPQDHALYGGSMVSVPVAAAMGAPADLVVLLGQRIGLFTGGRYGIVPAGAQVVQVDIDGTEPGRGGPIDLSIMADCRETLLALIEAAENRDWPDRGEWAATLKGARTLPGRQWLDAPVTGEAGLLHPFHACKALADALPGDAVIVCDGGESSVWVRDHIRPRGTGSFHITGYLGTLGVGQGFAIGAARAFPDRPVFLFAGDGGVGFHIQEFDTMVRHCLNVHMIVLNNACWGMSQNGQDLIYGKDKRSIVELADSAYEKVAEAFGGKGRRADTIEQIGAAMKAAAEGGTPSCINVRIDGAIINPVTMNMVGIKPGEKPKASPAADLAPAKGESEKVVMPYYDNVE
ncbi:thiamine pyrophosphate-binding protein [Sphingopyxis sp. PET50]|uniref:thiamine pyrophosphate-binding protein n=1 Tax=Sphingopyxis sp. PET50 TaxID=2976533 RepID=UPI0021B03665|nr:thiamine pyrophosphate-binding protein [Sphingopyxis sp. PET50]